jgi:hypothetical protein
MPDKIKLSIGIPTSGFVRSGFAHSLANMMGHLCSIGIKSRPGCELIIQLEMLEGSVIHTSREMIVSRSLESDSTHLLFLDDDMVFDADILDTMFAAEKPVVITNYLLKVEDPVFLVTDENNQNVNTTEESSGLQKVNAGGFGISLFETKVFKETPQPWFQPVWVDKAKQYTTEDVPFFYRIRKSGFSIYLDHDASKKISHIGNKRWNWTEFN